MRTIFCLATLLMVLPVVAVAQVNKPDPYSARIAMGPESYTWESARGAAPRVASRAPARSVPAQQTGPTIDLGTQRVLDYYGGVQARWALSQMPVRPTSVGQAPVQSGRVASKPFNTVVNSPTISPYLNLYRDEGVEGVPNYYAFVRPQQQQIQANQRQTSQLQRLERNVRQATYMAPRYTPSQSAGAARYGDTGRYYSSWQR